MGRSRITLAGLVAPVAIAALVVTGGAGGAAAPRHAGADCSEPPSQLTQSMNGRVSGCVRLGTLSAGPHTLVLQQILDNGPPAKLRPGKLPPGLRRLPKPPPPPSEPAVAVSLSPVSGGPGTTVTVTGRLRRPFGGRRFAYPDLCWAGCAHGLSYSGVATHWISPRVFRARFVIPAAPWLMNGTFRVAPLVSGRYAIAVQCMRVGRGCASTSEGAATFTLRGAHPPAWCRTPASCAVLRVTPSHALPGQLVRIAGFAPLTSVIGADEPFVYQTETLRGGARGPQVRFSAAHGLDQVTFGRAGLSVTAPPRYDDLRGVTPLAQVIDGVPQISADPAAPGTVAWCAGTTIEVSGSGGTTAIPSATARSTLQAMGFSFRSDPQVSCAAVAPIASASGAPAGLAAAFYVNTAAGAPPSYLAAVVTRDNGQTWAPIPVPTGSAPEAFGGFRYAGASLQAVFARRGRGGTRAYPAFDATRPVTEVSGSDGQTWTQAPLGCPVAGPCVSFGTYQPGNCAMNGGLQTVLRSADGGRRWSPLDFPYPVQDCATAELVATSRTSALLVDSTSTYPVLRTTDGGIAWRDVTLPPRGGGGDLTVLPDGSLLMSHGIQYQGRWKLLRRGARAWCELSRPAGALQRRFQLSAPVVIDGALWWLTGPADNPDASPTVSQLPLAALSC
jgi:hypothetical protein